MAFCCKILKCTEVILKLSRRAAKAEELKQGEGCMTKEINIAKHSGKSNLS